MSDLKRSRDTSPYSFGKDTPRARSEEGVAATTNKKARAEPDDRIPASAKVHTTGEFRSKIRTAIDLNRAIQKALHYKTSISSIGYSLTTYEGLDKPSKEQRDVLEKLRGIYTDVPLPYRYGTFKEPFHLTITRPNYAYAGLISPDSVRSAQLEEWYDNGAVAGYGDMSALATRVDREVRHARELVAGEFAVDPALVESVRATWAKAFIPGNVRAVPHKIHLYGPGGHFRAHRDTPEEGLVGTFLVGLGDSSAQYDDGAFCIGGVRLFSREGSWVAFHPDVPHAVSEMGYRAYRAVLAFKVFRDGEAVEHEAATREAALQQRVAEVVNAIPVPYGMLLEHKYHMGVQGLNGFDAILLSAVGQRPETAIHVFPVLISTHSRVYHDEGVNGSENHFSTGVLPLTEAHVDVLLASNTDVDSDANEEAKSLIKFFKDVEDVPFYSREFGDAADCWQQQKNDINYTGNEADGERESSIYLSYALLVLPGPTRDA